MHLQLQQLLSLSLILLLGEYTEELYLSFFNIISILLFTLLVEHLFIYLKKRRIEYFSFSSLSTAIGVMLMMVSPYLWIYMLVITFGLFQKHFLTIEGRHFFNPSNFALLMALALFYSDAHIVLGHLGDTLWLKVVLMVVGVAILVRIDRWIIPVGFVLSYLLFQYLLVVSSDPVLIMEEIYYRFYSVSFVLFVLFMLTDPKTTPSNSYQQLGFAMLIALGSALLDRIYGFRVQHLFMMLFLLSPIVPLVAIYRVSQEKNRVLVMTLLLLLLAIGVIMFIESQPPYYFEMDN